MANPLGVDMKVTNAQAVLTNLLLQMEMPEFKDYFAQETEKFFNDVVESTPVYQERMQPNWMYDLQDDGLTVEIANRGMYWAGLVVFGSENFVTSIQRGYDMSGRPYAHPKIEGTMGILEDVEGMLSAWAAGFMDGMGGE